MVSTVINSTPYQIVQPPYLSLEEWIQNPPDKTEWVNGELVEKNGMTAKHGRAQSRLSRYWGSYMISSGQGGEVYTETPCRTIGRGRCPDVAYLTPELLARFGENFTTLPQSFPLIAEIVSPTDFAEDVIAKAEEYLQSGSEEVWLVFPENKWIIIVIQNQQLIFTAGKTISTQIVLPGFTVAIDELLG
ncbi:MAG: Uma2 family endonuclease [Actinomycetota bacterium]